MTNQEQHQDYNQHPGDNMDCDLSMLGSRTSNSRIDSYTPRKGTSAVNNITRTIPSGGSISSIANASSPFFHDDAGAKAYHTSSGNKFLLFWMCQLTGKKVPAGVAFYNDPQGDYRLKVDVMPDDKILYLKAASLHDGKVLYRVEAAVRKEGRITHRAEIGTGYANAEEGYPIYMDVGPFSRLLVMDQVGA